MQDAWTELETRLIQLNSLSMPTNLATAKARETLADVRSGSGGAIAPVEFKGPITFLKLLGRTVSTEESGGLRNHYLRRSTELIREYFSAQTKHKLSALLCETFLHSLLVGTK